MAEVKIVEGEPLPPPKRVILLLSMEEAEALASLLYSGLTHSDMLPEVLRTGCKMQFSAHAPLRNLCDKLLGAGVKPDKWIAVTNDCNPQYEGSPTLSCKWPWLLPREEFMFHVKSYLGRRR